MDRRAIVVGSWSQMRERPSPQRVIGLAKRWAQVLATKRFGFKALNNKLDAPQILTNPTVGELTDSIVENPDSVTAETELLFYYVGHSVSSEQDDIKLVFGSRNVDGPERQVSLKQIVGHIWAAGVREIYLVLDTCHSGRTRSILEGQRDHLFVMYATGSGYAFEADFSEYLLRAFEHEIRRNDQRVDRRLNGVTLHKLFEEARRQIVAAGSAQLPEQFGALGTTVLYQVPPRVPAHKNDLAPSRSIYNRLHRILEMIKGDNLDMAGLREQVRGEALFRIRKGRNGEQDQFISSDRIEQYVDFVRKIQWVASPKGRLTLLPAGNEALNDLLFNDLLLRAIEANILQGKSFRLLDEWVEALIEDAIPPTFSRIRDRAGMKGIKIDLDGPTRLALELLPSTGRYMKGSADTIFPAEIRGA